jgi:hypothetical protein
VMKWGNAHGAKGKTIIRCVCRDTQNTH